MWALNSKSPCTTWFLPSVIIAAAVVQVPMIHHFSVYHLVTQTEGVTACKIVEYGV